MGPNRCELYVCDRPCIRGQRMAGLSTSSKGRSLISASAEAQVPRHGSYAYSGRWRIDFLADGAGLLGPTSHTHAGIADRNFLHNKRPLA